MSMITTAERDDESRTFLHVSYALYAVSPFVGFLTAIVAVVIASVKRGDAAEPWLASHYRWQIRTFWFGMLWAVVGVMTAIFFVGLFILLADFVWMIYRTIKGWIYLNDGKPMYAPKA